MQKELFPERLVEVKIGGVDVLGVPPGKGEIRLRFFTREQNNEGIRQEAKKRAEDQGTKIPERAYFKIEILPPNSDPMGRD